MEILKGTDSIRISDRLKQEDAVIRLLILTFLGVGLHLAFLLVITGLPGPSPAKLDVKIQLFLITYFAIGIPYSVAATLSFTPKRIVSPAYIQIATAVILIIGLSFFYYFNEEFLNVEEISKKLSIGVLTVTFLLLALVGFFQTEIVKLIVGLNGTENELNRRAYKINADFEIVKELIQQKSFLHLANFHVKESDNFLIFESRLRPFRDKVILVLGHYKQDEFKTSLATISYEYRYHSIEKSDNAIRRTNSIICELRNALKDINSNFVCDDDSLDNEASIHAKKIALAPTLPKIVSIKYIPRHIFAAMLGTAALFSIMTYGRFFGNFINNEIYYGSITVIIISAFFEFIPLIRESRQNRFH